MVTASRVVKGAYTLCASVLGTLARLWWQARNAPDGAALPGPARIPDRPWLSVIVPTLNEASNVASTLRRAAGPGVELVVVDGGSSDGTVAVARRYADIVLTSARGRASQMNAGADAARGEVLLFLHADTLLPWGYAGAVYAAMTRPGTVGGRFDVRLDAPGLAYACIGSLISLRSRLSRVATGDQAIFARRDAYERLGGYPELPLMEDIAFSRALKGAGSVACLRLKVITSARQWQEHGVLRTVLLMWGLRLLYYLRVPPRLLRRAYPDRSRVEDRRPGQAADGIDPDHGS